MVTKKADNKQAVKNNTNALQFLIPMHVPTQKQWWSNPSTQWLQNLPKKIIFFY